MTVNFVVVKGLLIRFVTLRIRNGDYTERQLARLVGVSQPQIHNVLKGARPLKDGLADTLLRHFRIGLLDLLRDCENNTRPFGEPSQDYIERAEQVRQMMLEAAPSSRKAAASESRNAAPAITRAS